MKGNTRNTKRLIAPITYMMGSEDDNLDIDTSGGATTIYIPNIIQSGLTLVDKKYYINDVTGNAGANPITIVCIGGNVINGNPNIVLSDNGISAQIIIADQNRYIANLSSDDAGGSTLTGANNGLNVVANTVKLGGALIMPTVITASSVNHIEIVDSFGSFFKTRDANANFSIADFGGNVFIGTNTNIFSYLATQNTYDNANIVVNFGSLNNYTNATDTWNFGDESIFTMSNQSFNFGRSNTYTNTINASILGNGNSVEGGVTIRVVGDSNYVNGNDGFIFGSNIIFTGSGGYLIGTNKTIDNTSSTYGVGNIFSFGSVFNVVGGEFVDSIVSLGFSNSINATQETRGVYIFGDSHSVNEFVTYSTLIGESCNFTRVDHCTALGIFTTLTDTTNIYTYGEGNTIESSTTISNFGTYNYISNSSNLGVFGNNNTITDDDRFYIGNNNNNLTIDGLTGRVVSLYPPSALDPLVWGHTFASPSGSAMAFHVGSAGLSNGYLTINNNGSFQIGNLGGNVHSFTGDGLNRFYFDGFGTGYDQRVGINITSPTATLHAVGEDATLANYAIKAQNNIASDLFSVRNDGRVFINTLTEPIGFGERLIVQSSTNEYGIVHTDGTIKLATFVGLGGGVPSGQIGMESPDSLYIYGYRGGVYDTFIKYEESATNKYWGLNTYFPTSAWHITGQSSTVADYALKVDNSLGSPLIYARNDGNVSIGIASPIARLHIKGSSDLLGNPILRVENLSNNCDLRFNDDGNIYINSPQYTGIQWQVAGVMATQIITTSVDFVKHRVPADFNWVRKTDDFIFGGISSGNFFFQGASATSFAPTAIVHVRGIDAGTNYALKVENNIGGGIISARNDGRINMSSLPISAVGLIAGDLWNNLGVVSIV